MAKQSAGILLYRFSGSVLEVFLVHPGGPFWAKKDQGVWSIPKGEYAAEDDALTAAKREFKEETGFQVSGRFVALKSIKQPSGKVIQVWAVEGDCNPAAIKSNTFALEWPPRSGRRQEFPEVDRAGWFDLKSAEEKIVKGQRGFLAELRQMLRPSGPLPANEW